MKGKREKANFALQAVFQKLNATQMLEQVQRVCKALEVNSDPGGAEYGLFVSVQAAVKSCVTNKSRDFKNFCTNIILDMNTIIKDIKNGRYDEDRVGCLSPLRTRLRYLSNLKYLLC